jgi:hypothetical protein
MLTSGCILARCRLQGKKERVLSVALGYAMQIKWDILGEGEGWSIRKTED